MNDEQIKEKLYGAAINEIKQELEKLPDALHNVIIMALEKMDSCSWKELLGILDKEEEMDMLKSLTLYLEVVFPENEELQMLTANKWK